MNEWEMKYRALVAAIDNPNYIANAERIVKAATDYSSVSCLTATEAFDMIMQAIFAQKNADNTDGLRAVGAGGIMTNHYSIPGSPPCRCAWCRSQPPHPLWAREEIVLGDDHPIRIANRQQAEQERQRIAADELADWLAQDVH